MKAVRAVATPLFDFFGQKFITNNLTAAYDLTDRTTFTLTYHYQQHTIGEGAANTTGYLSGISNYTINENGGTFGVDVQPANNWNINGSVEVLYADNVLTPVAPRRASALQNSHHIPAEELGDDLRRLQ